MLRSYDYKCADCGTIDDYIVRGDTLDEILSMSVTCSNCGSVNTERLISAPGGLKTNAADKPKTFVKKDMKHV